MKYHGNTVLQKDNDSSPETNLKGMEDCEITDRELKITVVKKLLATKKKKKKSSFLKAIQQ